MMLCTAQYTPKCSHKNGVPSQQESDEGSFDNSNIPECIRKLIDPHGTNPSSVRLHDRSSFGGDGTTYSDRDGDDDEIEDDAPSVNDNNSSAVLALDGKDINVNEMSLKACGHLMMKLMVDPTYCKCQIIQEVCA